MRQLHLKNKDFFLADFQTEEALNQLNLNKLVLGKVPSFPDICPNRLYPVIYSLPFLPHSARRKDLSYPKGIEGWAEEWLYFQSPVSIASATKHRLFYLLIIQTWGKGTKLNCTMASNDDDH